MSGEAAGGDPGKPPYWARKSGRNLADALRGIGRRISHAQAARMLNDPGCRLKSGGKREEGARKPAAANGLNFPGRPAGKRQDTGSP
ncbi:MAG: hypothetical protein LBW85_13845 [Deltaproteobacteria bacterium]|nr:hypothetical protein [Deltaproteobacteria bacterium]